MIVWGGYDGASYLDTGGRYNPATDVWDGTTITNAPSAREEHTAVWTGTEMIVWGGYYYDGINDYWYNTGGRYDPATDSWAATTTTNAPAGREYHTAVWAGGTVTRMIVWGGYYYDGADYYLDTGGRYNPATDVWDGTTTTNAPSARCIHTTVWAGGTVARMIVWGGYYWDGFNEYYYDTGGRYDPATDSWAATTTTDAPIGREYHTAVWDSDKMIIWGGYCYDISGHWLDTGGRYWP